MSNDVCESLRRALLACALSVAVSGLIVTAAFADDGVPDPSFGGDGRVVASVGWPGNEHPTAMAIDRQGRIVVVGVIARMMVRSVVVRLNPDGSLDRSFGQGGVIALEPIADSFSGVAIDSAGRIVLAGGTAGYTLSPGVVVARLLENGQHDPSFGTAGRMTVDLGGSGMYGTENFGYDLAFDAQGRILITGKTRLEEQPQMVVLRATDAGAPDNSFDEDGIAVVDFSDSEFALGGGEGRAITVDQQGRILSAGTAFPTNNDEFGIAGFNAQGHPDPTFAGDGTATIDFAAWSGEEVANDIAVDTQNRIVLAGSDGQTFALAARLLPDGTPDLSFAGDGKTALPIPGAGSAAATAIDGAGRILVAGSLTQGETRNAFLARLKSDGSIDGSFGSGGLVREDFLLGGAYGVDLAIDSAGRYLIAGRAFGRQETGFGVARYLNEPPPEQARRCRGKRATIVGTPKGDKLRGTGKRDVIVALGGNDRIRSLGGRDLVCAGAGRDLVRAGAGNDTVFGGRGDDRLFGQGGKDRLRGGRGRDRLVGGAGRDLMRGGSGRDVFKGAIPGKKGALGSFGKPRHYAVGPGPDSVAIGDFNGDHKSDLVVANRNGHNVSVLLGRGNGTYRAKKSYTAGTAPSSVAIGDFNGDRKQDVAVANSASGNVSILLGRGNGAFGAATDFAADFGADSVAVGDFNGDGSADLAVATSSSNSVSILLGHGDGTFGESLGVATHYAVGLRPDSVAVGDLNRDGKPDLAVANLFSHTISVLLGRGDGTFGAATSFAAGTSPTSVAIGDLNRDGKPDLAVADLIAPYGPGPRNQMPSGHVSVLLGKGDGTFGARTEFPVSRGKSPHPGTGSSAVAIRDLNGDRKLDLVVTLARPTSSGQVAILRGRGNGTFAAPVSFGTGTQPVCTVAERRTGQCPRASVAIGKLNRGAGPDLVVTNFGTNRVSVLLNGGSRRAR